MKKLSIILMSVLVSCTQVDNALESKNTKDTLLEQKMKPVIPQDEMRFSVEGIYEKYLPATLVQYIQKEHPTWVFPNENMWYPQLFKKYKTDSTLVNYISGDYDGNRNNDYALLIYKGNDVLCAVVFLYDGTKYKTIELTEVVDAKKDKIDWVLTLYKPGDYSISDPDLGPTDSKKVYFKYPAIGIGYFKELYEGGNDVFYWEENNLKSCLIEK